MAGFVFRKNSTFDWNGAQFRIREITPTEQVMLEQSETGALSIVEKSALLAEYAAGRLSGCVIKEAQLQRQPVFSRPMDSLSPELQKAAARRLHYLRAIFDQGAPVFTPAWITPILDRAAKDLGEAKPPNASTVFRWYRRHQANGADARSLIPRHDRKGRKTARQDRRILTLLQDVASQAYQMSPLTTLSSIHSRLLAKVEAENRALLPSEMLKAPSLRTTYRLLRSADVYDQIARKEGKASADRRLRVVVAGPSTSRLLERVEIDHTPLDLFVIDERTWLPLGRPLLTILLDKHSRMVLGYYLSFSAPSAAAVVGALRHAILPKTVQVGPLPSLSIENDWPCYGVPELLVVDNGLEFHGIDLEGIALDLGMTIQFCPKHTPRFKGAVERFLGTINRGFSHQVPGTSFARFYQRGDYDPLKHALLTFAECKQFIEKWMLDVYAATPHRGTGLAPRTLWRQNSAAHAPLLPESLALLKRRIGRNVTRKLRKSGFEVNGIRYSAPSMGPILRRYGEGVQVRVVFDPEDLGDVQIWGPDDDDPVQVRAVNFAHASGLTAQQSALIRQLVRDSGANPEDDAAIQRARDSIATEIKSLIDSRKLSARRRGAVLSAFSNTKPGAASLAPAAKPAAKSSPPPTASKAPVPKGTKPALPTPSVPKILKAFRMIPGELPDGDF